MAIGKWVLAFLPGVLLAAAVVACFFRRGRRIVAWTLVGAVLLAAGVRLTREAGNVVRGRGVGALDRAGWRWVEDEGYVWREGWSRTYDVGAEGMSRGWVGLTAWVPPGKKADQPYRGKLRLEWLDGEGRTVRESVAGAEGPEGLAFSPPAEGWEGPPWEWTLPLERFDAGWVAAGGLRLRVTVVERDGELVEFDEGGNRQVVRFCVWMVK